MTRIRIKETQKLVNQFFPEIKDKFKLNLEEVLVTRDDTIKEPTLMHAYMNEIGVNPSIDYKPEKYEDMGDILLEYGVLHELGHIVQFSINPFMLVQLGARMLGYKSGSKGREWLALAELYHIFSFSGKFVDQIRLKAFQEGFAEWLSIDIMPNFCSVSDDLTKYIELRQSYHLEDITYSMMSRHQDVLTSLFLEEQDYMPNAEGYNFFNQINLELGLDKVFKYVQNIQNYHIPEFEDLLFPDVFCRYLKKRLIK